MSEVTKKILFEDFYRILTTESIAESGDIEFDVATPPKNSMGVIVINPENSSLRERMFYHNVIGNKIYVRGVNRYEPKSHDEGSTVQINDSALIFNYLSDNVSTTFYIEKMGALQVKVWGGPILLGETQSSVNDTTLNLSNNNTNYIYYRKSDNSIQFSTSLPTIESEQGIIQVVVICSGGEISSINYKKYSIIEGIEGKSAYEIAVEEGFVGTKEQWLESLKGEYGEKGEDGKSAYEVAVDEGFVGSEQDWLDSLQGKDGNIGDPGPTGQFIEDVIIVDTSLYTVTTNNSTFVRITENATGNWVGYNLNGRFWADEDANIYNQELVSGTWGSVGLLEGITYIDGLTIDTLGTVRYTGQPAYRDRENIFTQTNTFKGFTDFEGDVGFKWYNQNTDNIVNFDASLGKKHIFTINNGGTKVMSFKDLKPGTNYEFFINVSGSSTILSFNGSTLTNCLSIEKVYCIGGGITGDPTYGVSLGLGTHHFVATLGTFAIHLVYTGTSIEVSNAVNIVP